MGFTEPIVHVDMDAFFVECERLRQPGLIGRPVVVGGGGTRGVVASASYEARAFGIRSAQPMGAARRRCTSLIVIPPDHSYYQEVSASVFEVLRSVSPIVEGLSIDEAFVDVSGLTRHYSSPVEAAARIRERIRSDVGLPASAGVAASKFIAKLASDKAKPEGMLHVPVDRQIEFLHPLPVSDLWGVGTATQAALQRVGIDTVGGLAELEVETLQTIVGASAGAHLAALARGHDPRAVVPDSEAKSISVEHTYHEDVHDPAVVRAEVLRHASEVTWRLRRAGLAARTVTLKLRFADFETPTRSVTLATATDVGRDIRRAATELIDRMPRRGIGVRLVGVGLSHLEPAAGARQLGFDRPGKWDDLEQAMDGVRNRFGSDAVRPAALDEYRADRP